MKQRLDLIQEAYERLILDALNGDGTLFIRGDEAETSWGLLSPVLIIGRIKDRRVLKAMQQVHGGQFLPINFFVKGS